MNIKEKLGNRIRSLRKDAQWSQEQLAYKARLHRTYLSAVERGEKNISVENIEKIANALGVDLSDLFTNDVRP